ISFHKEPLRYLDDQLRRGVETFWLPGSVLCVAEPQAAKAVLANPDGLFEEHSDFFHTARGPYGPRSAQRAIGRYARQLLTDYAAARGDRLATSLTELRGTSDWPDAGNRLIYRHFADVLVAPGTAPDVVDAVEQVVEHAVLAGARERRSRITRFFFRRKLFRILADEMERRLRSLPADDAPPRDLFDVLALGALSVPDAPEAARADDLGQLYLPLLFAIVGSVGFTLAWSVHLLGQNPGGTHASSGVVHEALRLWPVAWQLARRPAQEHEILGIKVDPGDMVLVCPYVTQRHPAYWPEPERFLPERWAGGRDYQAFFPFGWGPHTCAAAALTLRTVQDVVELLARDFTYSVTPLSARAFDRGPSLAPPRFRLDLSPN
ncbi:MAG: cytochrome P450, partial [Acidobacteriota bacterium]